MHSITTFQAYPTVFKPGLGKIKGITAILEIKPDVRVRPKFCRARLVPYALQEAVEAAYNCQETEGIVEKVQFSEWATPVHGLKADGTMCSIVEIIMLIFTQEGPFNRKWFSGK